MMKTKNCKIKKCLIYSHGKNQNLRNKINIIFKLGKFFEFSNFICQQKRKIRHEKILILTF